MSIPFYRPYQALNEQDGDKVEEILQKTAGALEDEACQDLTFQKCGNAVSLKAGLITVQNILVEQDKEGSNMAHIFRYAKMLHEEGDRMYGQQLDALLKSA